MVDHQLYRFELSQNVFLKPEDSESENQEVNDRLEGTFWCSCERCHDQIMSTQIECVFCREQPEEENKTAQGRILSLYYMGPTSVAVNGKTIFVVTCFRYL